MPKKKRHSPPQTADKTPRIIADTLVEADKLIERRDWAGARALLEPLYQRYPQRHDILLSLSEIYYELQDQYGYLNVAEQLAKLTPRNPEVVMMLAGASLVNMMPARALQLFRQVFERWPEHERVAELRKIAADLEDNIGAILAELGLGDEGGFEIAALHDEMRSLLARGRFAEVRRIGEELLSRRPDFIPALNNLSLAYGIEGRLDQAIASAQHILEIDPSNYHALANLVHFSLLSGNVSEAKAWGDKLKESATFGPDIWVKRAEAFSFLGDDRAVLDSFERADQANQLDAGYGGPMLYHLAAVAALRQGREDEARRNWRQALKLSPGLRIAQENLDDLSQPIGQRHAPWPFPFDEWMTRRSLDDLVKQVQPSVRHGSEVAVTQSTRRYLKQHPEMLDILPILLDRGDPLGRQQALRLAIVAETPELNEALRDFAFSQRGPDAIRMQAAQAAFDAGLLPSRHVTLWSGGEWREIALMSYTLHDDVVVPHKAQVERLMVRAIRLLNEQKPAEAEDLIKQALEIEPDSPDILNNLAVAYSQLARDKEAEALIHQVVERFPDYVFARVSVARTLILRHRIGEARALLEPLLERERFHVDEFAHFCAAQAELLLAERNRDAARTWLDMWANVDPDNPALADLRARVDRPRLRDRLFGGRS
ncbi:MAG TPA: tetratricopeptide repeat protein [Roseiflexaceae bacterium]|nr:tetratricopeptide repeat protein [Roseiflexaceae bacterium]